MANNSKIARQTLQNDDLMNRILFTSRFKYFVTFQREREKAPASVEFGKMSVTFKSL
jgi:hypothetical protein